MKYSAVLFDLDGTLLNSLEGIALAMNAILSETGLGNALHTGLCNHGW